MGSGGSPAVGSSPEARVPSAALPVWGRASHDLLGQSQPWTAMVGPTVSPLHRRNAPHTPETTVSTLLGCLCPHSHALPTWHCRTVPAHRSYLMSRGWGCGVPLCPKSTLLPPSCPTSPAGARCSFPARDSPTAPPQPYQHPLPGKWHRRTGLTLRHSAIEWGGSRHSSCSHGPLPHATSRHLGGLQGPGCHLCMAAAVLCQHPGVMARSENGSSCGEGSCSGASREGRSGREEKRRGREGGKRGQSRQGGRAGTGSTTRPEPVPLSTTPALLAARAVYAKLPFISVLPTQLPAGQRRGHPQHPAPLCPGAGLCVPHTLLQALARTSAAAVTPSLPTAGNGETSPGLWAAPKPVAWGQQAGGAVVSAPNSHASACHPIPTGSGCPGRR